MQTQSRASALRDCLGESEAIAHGADIVLHSYNSQLESLIKSVELVAERAQVLTTAQKRIDNALKQASQLLQHLDTPARVEAKIKQGPKAGLTDFVNAVRRLQECTDFLSENKGMQAASKSLRLGFILQKEATTLAFEEFQNSLKKYARIVDLKSVRADADAFKPEALNNTQNILPAETMDKVKRLHECLSSLKDNSCIKAFCEVRCAVLDKSMLAGLEIKLLTPEEFNKLSWPAAEARIRVWISICLGTTGQLAVEQRLIHQIFGRKQGKEAYQQLMNPVVQLLHTRFIAKILGYKCVPEKVYGLLEAGEQLQATLSNLDFTPHSGAENSVLQTQFSASSGNEIYSKKGQFSYRLAEEARLTYNQFCNNLKQESLRQSVGSACVHMITAQVMTHLKRLAKHTSCPHILFSKEPIPRQAFLRVSVGGPNQEQAMQKGLEQVLALLWETLIGIASYCKNPAMASVFLMTNAHYQAKNVRQSALLRGVISEAWQEECEARLELYGQKYQQQAWGPILQQIGDPDQVPEMKTLNWLKDKIEQAMELSLKIRYLQLGSIKEKWKKVNSQLSNLIAEQKHWSISDASLRSNLRRAIIEDFIPTYERFWTNQQKVKFSRHPGKYFRYSPESLRTIINREIFQDVSVDPDFSVKPGFNKDDLRILHEAAGAVDKQHKRSPTIGDVF